MDFKYLMLLLILVFFAISFLFSRLRKKDVTSVARDMDAFELLEITISKNNDETKDAQFSALSAENMFSLIHGLLKDDKSQQEHFSFEIVSSGSGGIKFYVALPTHILKFVEGQIYAQYPDATIKIADDYCGKLKVSEDLFEIATIKFTRPGFFPIKTFRDFETDPLAAFTTSLSQVKDSDEVWFQLVIKPIADTWQPAGFTYVKNVREGTASGNPSLADTFKKAAGTEAVGILKGVATGMFSPPPDPAALKFGQKPQSASGALVRLTPIQELETRSIENKLSKVGYQVMIRVLSSSESHERLNTNLRSVLATLKQYTTTSSNNFAVVMENEKDAAFSKFVNRVFNESDSIIMNGEELATLYHLPTSKIDTPNIAWSYSRKSEPPVNLPTTDCIYLGDTMFRSKEVRFGIHNNDDRLRHMYVVGKSGVGKSTLFEVMITQDIKNGAGVCMLDPHGETIDKVLERIPDERIKDVIYFDPSDSERPIGLNLLEVKDPSQKNLAASGLLEAIKQHFDYSWGPRLEYLLNYALLTLAEIPGTTMLSITRLLEDKNYRNYILHQVNDSVVIRFWEKEYKELAGNQKFITEAISPIQNKVNRFLSSTTIRNILSQPKSTLDLEDVMNTGKILLINLSKGKIGADNANLLGALIVSRIQYFALQRANIRPEDRKTFYLYADEFQNFATGSFKEILSESRKYGLGLYLTHQYTAQLPEDLLKAVLGNVGTIINFASGAMDAKVMANEFVPFESDDIITLQKFHIYVKLMINGMTSLPFSARILTPWTDTEFLPPKTSNKEKVLAFSREKYGVDRAYVEARINKWIETPFDKGVAISQEFKKANPNAGVVPSSQE